MRTESLYGTNLAFPFPADWSARAEITQPNVVRDLQTHPKIHQSHISDNISDGYLDFKHLHASHMKINPHLLILLPSLSLSPAAPVLDTRSLPARSTRLILLTFSPEFCLTHHNMTETGSRAVFTVHTHRWGHWGLHGESGWKGRKRLTPDWRSYSVCVTMILKTACDRLLSSFMLVAATVRDLFPSDINTSMS